jgi:geranylgeranyl diphosphate synthase type II
MPDPVAAPAWLGELRAAVDAALPSLLPARHGPPDQAAAVHDAMAHALLSPGKRIRPALTLAVGRMYRVDPARLMPAACAVEMVHAASLILDDLPCMDDAPLRRGRPSCHAAFGEATAILAAIGLLTHAFGVVAGATAPFARERLRCTISRRLAAAIGTDGVIGGQHADLEMARPGAPPGDLARLEFIHSHKTGSLFIASAEMGAELSGATAPETEALAAWARNLGLAFQITDDLIDAGGDEAAAGKPVGTDAKAGRPTFVALCGVEGARELASDLVESSLRALEPFGRRARALEELSRFIAVRDR